MRSVKAPFHKILASGPLGRVLKDPVFWVITILTLGHTFIHYAAYIPDFGRIFRGLPYFNLHILHELEYLGIIAIAAYRYGWKGGVALILLTLTASIPFILTPFVFGYDPRPGEFRDRAIEVGATLALGALLTFLANEVVRRRDRLISTIAALRATHGELAESEGALRRSEARFRDLVENTNDFIWEMDAQGRYTYCSPSVVSLLGYAPQDLLGRSALEFMAAGEAERLGRQLLPLISSERPYHNFVCCFQGKAGALVHMECSGNPAYDELGHFKGYRGVDRNITERMQREEERARHAVELEKAFHNLQDTQQQLIQSAKLASLGELVAGVAHELNNPLTGIWGTAQLLMRSKLDDAAKANVELIHDESERSVKIVQNLLSFARKHRPEKQCASINEALLKTLELRAYEIRVNNIDLVTDLQEDLPQTWFDFNQMQQVFLNIIINAEQAMSDSQGKGSLSVKTRAVGDSIQVQFMDNGPGIPHDIQERIFNPFFTTKEVGKGTGLGLSLCYGIVQEHGGTIIVASEPGKGTTFTIQIPATSEEPEAIHEHAGSQR